MILQIANKAEIAIIDDDRYEEFCAQTWTAFKGANNSMYVRNLNGEYLHRLIMNCPVNMCVDHIDGNGLNNVASNLRVCTHGENMTNRKVGTNNKSGYRGVWFDRRASKETPWRASIVKAKQRFDLGRFRTPEDAFAAYCAAAKQKFGEFFQESRAYKWPIF